MEYLYFFLALVFSFNYLLTLQYFVSQIHENEKHN